MDKVTSMVEELIKALGDEIVDEAVDVAKDALWNDGMYCGPGASLKVYHKAYMIAVLQWYKQARNCEGCSESPPKCAYLYDEEKK